MGSDKWAQQLKEIESNSEFSFVFVGGPNEVESHEKIFSMLNSKTRHINITGKTNGLLDLLNVIFRANAYVGKDCGTMHLASACGIPVLSVFGGGHRDRFFPLNINSTAVTLDVPCRGCDWRCHLHEHVCVTGLPDGILSKLFLEKMSHPQSILANKKLAPNKSIVDLCEKYKNPNYPENCHRIKKEKQKKLAKNLFLKKTRRLIQSFFEK